MGLAAEDRRNSTARLSGVMVIEVGRPSEKRRVTAYWRRKSGSATTGGRSVNKEEQGVVPSPVTVQPVQAVNAPRMMMPLMETNARNDRRFRSVSITVSLFVHVPQV